MYRRVAWLPLSCVLLLVGACQEQGDLTLPTDDEVAAHYTNAGQVGVDLRGNVAVITVPQSADQLRRGGSLWAKVGPYIYLFSEETRTLFDSFPGLAAVRVITEVGEGTEVANAMLPRDALTDVLWRRSLNIAGHARRDGTKQVRLLEQLIEWGEAHTEFEYNQRFVRR